MTNDIDRRTVLLGAGAVAAGVTLAACGTSATPAASSTTTSSVTSTATAIGKPTSASSAEADPPSSQAASTAAAANGIGSAADVKVGSGKIFEAQKVVVTQPTAGQYKAFTAVCTHQGCIVATISAGKINCPCHGSSFSIADGSVINGPASSPLAEQKVTVSGDTITLA